MSFSLFSCKNSMMNQVAEQINAQCPNSKFKGFVLNQVKFEENTFIFDLAVDEIMIKDKLESQGIPSQLFDMFFDKIADEFVAQGSVKEIAKSLVDLSGQDEKYKTFIDLCISEKVDAKFNISVGDKVKSIIITSNEMNDIVNH